MKLILPYPPSANVYWRLFQGKIRVSPEARAYKAQVGLLCASKRMRPLDGPVSLSLTVYRPRRQGDLSNRIKVLEDALEGWCFHGDDQVELIHALRLDDPSDPRVEVTVEGLPWNQPR